MVSQALFERVEFCSGGGERNWAELETQHRKVEIYNQKVEWGPVGKKFLKGNVKRDSVQRRFWRKAGQGGGTLPRGTAG